MFLDMRLNKISRCILFLICSASLQNLKYFFNFLRSCNISDNSIGNDMVNVIVNDIVKYVSQSIVNVIANTNFIENHY